MSRLTRPWWRGGLEFKNVSFSYPGQETRALNSVSFSIQPGERVALIGRVGSGKSTVGKLALALYRPSDGIILMDGVDIRQIDPAELRRNIASVPQDVTLFFGSLKENLLFGNPSKTDAEILQAAAATGVDRMANLHPHGFDLQVGERGDRLSSGQRQTVAVSRALLKGAPAMILDEPTSSMDSATEDQVRRNLAAFLENRTLLLVTHRTALLDLVDRIIVLDGGRVIADGPKEDVLTSLYKNRPGIKEAS
jgi:ATP-binding cassette subfamily C protein LapB